MGFEAKPAISPGILLNLEVMQQMQQQRSLRRVNELVNVCFDECVSDMSLTRQLTTGEAACIQSCTEKFLAFSALVGSSFVASLAADPKFKA